MWRRSQTLYSQVTLLFGYDHITYEVAMATSSVRKVKDEQGIGMRYALRSMQGLNRAWVVTKYYKYHKSQGINTIFCLPRLKKKHLIKNSNKLLVKSYTRISVITYSK